MTHRIDFRRAFLAVITAAAVALALVLVAGGSPASADSPATLPWTNATNEPSYWVTYGSQTHGEVDWVCVKEDNEPEVPGAYVIGDPPVGSVWRLLVVKAGSEINDLNWDPVSGQSFGHSRQGGWSHVILCSRPAPTAGRIIIEKQTVPDGDQATFGFAGDVSGTLSDGQTAAADVAPGQYTSTETVPAGWVLTSIVCDDGNSSGNTGTKIATFNVEAGETVTCVFTNTKDEVPTPTPPADTTTTTIEDIVFPTSIVSTTTTIVSTTVEVSDETLPFTGFENGTTGLLALILVASGVLALVGARVFREETDE